MAKNKLEFFLQGFSASLQLGKIYGCSHPKFKESAACLFSLLQEILAKKNELRFAVIDRELAGGGDIFFELSKKLTGLIERLANRQIEKIVFKKGITLSELISFLSFLSLSEPNNLQDYFREKNITNIEAGKIKAGSSRQVGKKEPESLFAQDYDSSFSRLSGSLAAIIQGQPLDFANFQLVVDSLAKGVDSHYQEILKLSLLKGKDTVTFAHILNVSFLAICFSKSLGFSGQMLRDIGLAALFHDIGKLYISDKILKGPSISQAEFEKVKVHSFLGAGVLLKYFKQTGELSLVVALEHHLRYDLKGYPQPCFLRRPHLISLLIAICDVYDALSQRRCYKKEYYPEEVYYTMKENRGTQLHPGLFDAFFRFIGVWPNGSKVVLTDGSLAQVVSQNQSDIFLPKVKVISGQPALIDLSQNDAGLKIKQSRQFNSES